MSLGKPPLGWTSSIAKMREDPTKVTTIVSSIVTQDLGVGFAQIQILQQQAPYLYVIIVDDLEYFKETQMQGKNKGIYFPNYNQLLNIHFTNDLALTLELTQHSFKGTISCLDTFTKVVGIVIDEDTTKVFLNGKEDPPKWKCI
jgi:hypothetical protein